MLGKREILSIILRTCIKNKILLFANLKLNNGFILKLQKCVYNHLYINYMDTLNRGNK